MGERGRMSESVRAARGSAGRRIAVAAAIAVLALGGARAGWDLLRSADAIVDPAAARLAPAAETDPFPPRVDRLDGLLEPVRARHRVPALAAAVVHGDSLVALGVVGVRRAGRPEAALWTDRFHIGSDTKSMTATVAAMLVEDGRLSWDARLGELFPDLAAGMRPAYRRVTVAMLAQHRSGLPDDRSDVALYLRLRALRGPDSTRRLAAARILLARPPAFEPGTGNQYANGNYDVLGAAMERVTGRSWEDLVRERLFAPLGMRASGFGAPAAPGRLDQPWGHAVAGRWPRRLFWTSRSSVAPANAPAGDVSLSMPDWARYATLHLAAARGAPRMLTADSFRRLHEEVPAGSGFASGWGVAEVPPCGRTLQHAGSDGWWFAIVEIEPGCDRAFLVAANVGGERGQRACQEALTLARGRDRPLLAGR